MTPTTREAVERYNFETQTRRERGTGRELVLASDYDALLAGVEGLRRDAERYRALSHMQDVTFQDHGGMWYSGTGLDLDMMIDTAMAALAPSEEADLPVVRCPKCKAEQVDRDGFGFIACVPGCGYCTHPSLTDGVCGICGVKP